jgi:hypothetical protein
MLFFRAFFIYQVGVISAFIAPFLYSVGIVLVVTITIFTTVYLIIHTAYRALLGFLDFFYIKEANKAGRWAACQENL